MAPARASRMQRRTTEKPSPKVLEGNEESNINSQSSEDSLDARKLAEEMTRDVQLQ